MDGPKAARERAIEEHDEERAGGVLQEAGGVFPVDGREHLCAGEHEEQHRCADPLSSAPHEHERAGDLDRGEQRDVMRWGGHEGLDARHDDQRAEDRPVRRQDPRRAHGAGSGSTNVRRAISVAS